MKVGYQADADLDRTIVLATVRWAPAIDFRTAEEADLQGVEDTEVLARAAASGRILVTHDRRTMPRHFATFVAEHRSPGVLVVSQKMPVSLAAEELVLIWASSEAEEWVDRICALPL